MDPDKGSYSIATVSNSDCTQVSSIVVDLFSSFASSEEEEEEEEESDDEGQELSLPSDGAVLGEESLEPPAKLARTDQGVLFTSGSTDN